MTSEREQPNAVHAPYCTLEESWMRDLATAEAEARALRDALQQIAGARFCLVNDLQEIARAALAGGGET